MVSRLSVCPCSVCPSGKVLRLPVGVGDYGKAGFLPSVCCLIPSFVGWLSLRLLLLVTFFLELSLPHPAALSCLPPLSPQEGPGGWGLTLLRKKVSVSIYIILYLSIIYLYINFVWEGSEGEGLVGEIQKVL